MYKITCTFTHDNSTHEVFVNEHELAFPTSIREANQIEEYLRILTLNLVQQQFHGQKQSVIWLQTLNSAQPATDKTPGTYEVGYSSNLDVQPNCIITAGELPGATTVKVTIEHDARPAQDNLLAVELHNQPFVQKGLILNPIYRAPLVRPQAQALLALHHARKQLSDKFKIDITHFDNLRREVNARIANRIVPLKQKLQQLAATVAALEQDAATDHTAAGSLKAYDTRAFAHFVTAEIARIDFHAQAQSITAALTSEEQRLTKFTDDYLREKVESAQVIYQTHLSQLRHFNRLLAFYLYRAALGYWDEIQDDKKTSFEKKCQSFNAKFGSIGLHIEKDHKPSGLQEVYQLFDGEKLLSLQDSEALICGLLADGDSNKVTLNGKVLPLFDAFTTWPKALNHIHANLLAFERDCRQDPLYHGPEYAPFTAKPLFSSERRQFKWASNAYTLKKIVNNNIQHALYFSILNDEAGICATDAVLLQTLGEACDNATANNLLNSASTKIAALHKAIYPLPQKGNRPKARVVMGLAPTEVELPLLTKIEQERERLTLLKLQTDGTALYNSARALHTQALTLKCQSATREWHHADETIKTVHFFLQQLKAEHLTAFGLAFANLERDQESLAAARSADVAAQRIPVAMLARLTQLKTLSAELNQVQHALELNKAYANLASPAATQKEAYAAWERTLAAHRELHNVLYTKNTAAFTHAVTALAEQLEALKLQQEQTNAIPSELEQTVADLARLATSLPVPNHALELSQYLVKLLRSNLPFWEQFTHYKVWGGGEKVQAKNGSYFNLPTGLADMFKCISQHERQANFLTTEAQAKQLLAQIRSIALCAQERQAKNPARSQCLFSTRTRDPRINAFYIILANGADAESKLEQLKYWDKTSGPGSLPPVSPKMPNVNYA
jgi:hypothetical protein